LAYHIAESKASKVGKLLEEETARGVRLQRLIQGHMSEEESKLKNKIAMRQKRAEGSRLLRDSGDSRMDKLNLSCISTYNELSDDCSVGDSLLDLSFTHELSQG
jgi:hypothetical protein